MVISQARQTAALKAESTRCFGRTSVSATSGYCVEGVNEKRQAVGYADDSDGGSRAVLFSDGHVTDLGSLGDEPSSALSINDAGQIVGSSAVAEGKMHAFLWEKGHLYDLNQLIPSESGWVLLAAYRINAKGQVLAYGFYQGRTHACLLSPGQGGATAVKK
jgi:probable HAF family extracellular repeat protein